MSENSAAQQPHDGFRLPALSDGLERQEVETFDVFIEVSTGYDATATCCGVRFVGEAACARDWLAVEIGQRFGTSLEDLRFDVYESFDGGPVHVTRGWRFEPPPTWGQILQTLEVSYQRAVT